MLRSSAKSRFPFGLRRRKGPCARPRQVGELDAQDATRDD